MADKRRDTKGRILRYGEVQRADGKYMYRYTDACGERQTVYSWKLVETDKIPSGVKNGPALRTMIAAIEKDLKDGIRPNSASEYILNDLFDSLMELRTDLKETTRCNYLRHTFCTRMCEIKTNTKIIQEVMGHKNIRTTMNVYNEATSDAKIASFKAAEGAIYLG